MVWMAKAFGLALVIGALGGSAVAAPPVYDVGRARASFSIELPDGCALEESQVRATYAVFNITCEGRVYGGVYAGADANPEIPRSRIMITETRWPTEIQAWSVDVPDDQDRADAIVASVRAKRVKVALG
jgi:hypothetical protein